MSSNRNEAKDPYAALGKPSVEATDRWVRVKAGGETIADSKRALLLLQYGPGGLPTYYFPLDDVREACLVAGGGLDAGSGRDYRSLNVGGRRTENVAWIYAAPPPELAALNGYVSFAWEAMDAWYEEEEEIFVHARDPYKRVDVIPSSRRVRVELEGLVLADSCAPCLLFETHLPTRFYLPRQAVNFDHLIASDLETYCPYKGKAQYWSIHVGQGVRENLVWSYPDPIPENPKIKDLFCFFNERVDITLDGELRARPVTPWS